MISVQIFENLDYGQQLKKKWMSINLLKKSSISDQNFENLNFGQHFLKNFDSGSKS